MCPLRDEIAILNSEILADVKLAVQIITCLCSIPMYIVLIYKEEWL